MTIQQPVPCPPPWYQPASQCFDQVKQFEEMLQAMVDKTVTDKLNTAIQQGTLPPGVVDGSNAQTGQVGEFMQTSGTLAYAAYPTDTIGNVSFVMPAGDWDMRVSGGFSGYVGPVGWVLDPFLTQVSSGMAGTYGISGGAETVVVIGQTARGNFTVPTLLTFRAAILQSSDSSLTAGVFTMYLEARRMR